MNLISIVDVEGLIFLLWSDCDLSPVCLQVDVVRAEKPLETVATAYTEATGVSENATRAEGQLVIVKAMDKDANTVKAEEPLEKIEMLEMDAIGKSNNAALVKNEEDLGEFEHKGFPSSAVVIDLLFSSSDEMEFMEDQRNGGEAAEVRKKKKRRIEEERDVRPLLLLIFSFLF